MGTIEYSEPPPVEDTERFDDYILKMHNQIFGVGEGTSGDLNTTDNISNAVTDHDNLTNVTEYQHHGAGSHKDLVSGGAVTNSSASTVSVTGADADATYDANEQTLINELKGDVNSLVTDINAIGTQLNALLASLRAAKIIAT